MALHEDEQRVTKADAQRLLTAQCPEWRQLPIRPAGHGTDNVMLRLGDGLVVRFPRTESAVPDLEKDATWLPVLAPHLPVRIPEIIFRGTPDENYLFPWAVYRWIEGAEPSVETVTDWPAFGADLGGFVDALCRAPLPPGQARAGLSSFRGGLLGPLLDEGLAAIDQIRRSPSGDGLDLDAVEGLWRELATTAQQPVPDVWLHADLRAANLVAGGGALVGVIDFGTLGLGQPPAEHACVWELPRDARDAYRQRLDLDDATWRLGRGWAMLPSLTGLPYYWESWPEFARLCRRRIETLLATED